MHLSYFLLMLAALVCLVTLAEGETPIPPPYCETDCDGICRHRECNRDEQDATPEEECADSCGEEGRCCVPNPRECEDDCNGRCRAKDCNKGEFESNNPLCIVDCDERNGRICCVEACLDGQFTCDNGKCINGAYECDGEYNDCGDNSDENHCGGACEMNVGVEADSGCGSRVTTQPRVVGGQDALPGEWPWQAQLHYIPWGMEVCGGTLVGPRHVVSAAHCFATLSDSTDWRVRLGRFTRDGTSPADDESIEVGIQQIITHDDYDTPVNSDNDIALLILDQDVNPTDFINYACLDDTLTFNEDNSCCYITGWGDLQAGGSPPNILQEAVVPILANDLCSNLYSDYDVTDNMVCAGYTAGGIDTCQGDSGGPLVCIHTEEDTGLSRWHLAGITSWGVGCAWPNRPGVYTRVSSYYAWLQGHDAM